ncbi:MAG: tail fiber domain-containing protein, partial [Candidatus Aenigmatarchaeota archaeon]
QSPSVSSQSPSITTLCSATNIFAPFLVNSGGKIGIGTSTPLTQLDVAGKIRATGICLGNSCYNSFPENYWSKLGNNIFYNSGDVGIGTTSPVYKLHIYNSTTDGPVLRLQDTDGTCDANPESTGVSWSCSSDIRLKQNIRDAPPILGQLMQIPIRQFELKASNETKIGVIAQELQPIMPELVSEDENGYLMVKELSSWQLLKAIQEQQQQIEQLKLQVSQLKAMVCSDHPNSTICNSPE